MADDDIIIDDSELENDLTKELEKQLLVEPAAIPTTLDTVITIDCLPEVGEDKLDKLKAVLVRTFNACADISIDKTKIHMPMADGTSKTMGYAFVELKSLDEVSRALTKLDQYKLDKRHTFIVNRFSEIERMENVPDEYVPPEMPEFTPKDNLKWWLSDRREQYAIMYAKELEVFWHEPIKPQPELIFKKTMNEVVTFQWSTFGSYYAIIVRGGRVILLGGPNWKPIHSYDHHGVYSVQFSPQERYLITCLADNSNEKEFYTFWNIKTGKKIRSFPQGNFFKWSHDDKYFARMSENLISIYEAASGKLLGKKMKINNVDNFEWSPSSNVMSIFIQGENNTPSFLSLIEIPSRREIYRKSLFSVKSCRMTWQSEGRFLCLQVDRFKKNNKKLIVTSFEIFNLESKTVTTEILPMKDTVRLFAWEPRGTRFGIIHGPPDTPIVNVSFYQISKKKLEHKNTLEKRSAQLLFWAPCGSYLVIGGKGGTLEFYNAAMGEVMSQSEHHLVTNLYWDPTGRYVCTFVSAWKMQLENGYVIRNFKGDIVNSAELKDQFYDFQWRPRPPSLLSKEQEANIRKNLKTYAAKYAEEDHGLLGVIVDEKFKEQQRLLQEHADRMKAYAEKHKAEREARIQLRDGALSDDESDYVEIETFVERVVDEQEEEIEVE